MFFDPTVDKRCVIDRTSSSGKQLRRVMIIFQDGGVVVCKANGTVCRIFHVSSVTHLIHAPVDGIRGRCVLIRIAREHDLLFTIVVSGTTGSHPNMSLNLGSDAGSVSPRDGGNGYNNSSSIGEMKRSFHEALDIIDAMAKHRSAIGGLQLNVVERQDPALLKAAADVTCPPTFVKPRAWSVTHQLFVPILFDDFSILSQSTDNMAQLSEPFELVSDASFVTLLKRAIAAHPLSAEKPPKLDIEAPPPFGHLQVSDHFFAAFCAAFDEALPLTVHVRSHLPNITTFRASQRFWRFLTHTLRVTRPPEGVLSLLTTATVEAHLEGEEGAPLACTVPEWNDAIVAWEMNVRAAIGGGNSGSPSMRRRRIGAADALGGDESAAANALFWQSFVSELEAAKVFISQT